MSNYFKKTLHPLTGEEETACFLDLRGKERSPSGEYYKVVFEDGYEVWADEIKDN